MTPTTRVVAIDLGASSGRVISVRVGPGILEAVEEHRFPNEPVTVAGTMHWDVLRLMHGIEHGLRRARLAGPVDAIAIDSWAVDYGLLGADGRLLGNPVHYRDDRTVGILERLGSELDAAAVYRTTGLQQQRFNTLGQLTASRGSAQLAAARRLLMIPDLLAYWLTGVESAEVTNASTTQLFDATRRAWDPELVAHLGLPLELFPVAVEPGTVIGGVLPDVARRTGIDPGTPVVAVGSHDTASAVVGVPAQNPDFAYISCGTWSLVGLELDAPVLTDASREANATNELGVDGTVRYLRNTMGLWMLQECQRHWASRGESVPLDELLGRAGAEPVATWLVDADDEQFLAPGDMPGRIARAAGEHGPVPQTPAQVVRCILDSLALAYRRSIARLQELSGREVRVVHVVGGGSQNALLCQLTADACRLPVVAGPTEAAALGNALVQARALGAIAGGLPELRALLASTQPLRFHQPGGDPHVWADAADRLHAPRNPHRTTTQKVRLT
ncbi:rhamnulokinase (plasmid) [Cellulomonas sp. WB94]|uniref:rhamnulokinase n=1 Tax=Cellulomonas sp. WB94 TaxID=2173174 RepID=UPI000D57AA48|nr:rhamnulokinase family protein [Cellulomonas sp. WB94]PVU84364.1 rhamnulokinase [Cellulomonas sp. WB94]